MNVDVRFSDGAVFADIMRAVSLLVDEASLVFDAEGLRMNAMDPAHVVLVVLNLPRDRFEEYRVEGGRVFVNLNMRDFMRFLRRGGETPLSMLFDAEKNRLNLMFQEGGRSKSFSLKTYETLLEPTPIPRLSFSSEVVIDMQTFKQAVEDCFLVDDVLRIKASTDALVFSAGNPSENTYSMRVGKDGPTLQRLECSEPTAASYSLVYLEKIVDGCHPLADTVSLAFTSNKPMRISVSDEALTYFIAPRLD
ncbi:MAG: hypothetical protein QXF97_06510 [Candidatus Caldarchaeum sp.]